VSDHIRSRQSRALAENALVRLVHAYGEIPEFVLLGGLVPDLLCSSAPRSHVGTTDVDVQVDLEIQSGLGNGQRLERALIECQFTPDRERIWRWQDESAPHLVIKVEFFADLSSVADRATVSFDGCESLGAVNLRGTGFAARDWSLHALTTDVEGTSTSVQIRVATLPAYVLAKVHAAHGRGLQKDWYDLAYVLLHNDAGGPMSAADLVVQHFSDSLSGATATALHEFNANFAESSAQGALAYAGTMVALHPDLDGEIAANDAVAAVAAFMKRVGEVLH